MPHRNHNNHFNHHNNKDNTCLEVFVGLFFIYCTFEMWTPTCSWFFNMYIITSYTFIIIARKYQTSKMDQLEESRKVQMIMMGIMMPLFILHTWVGGHEFFTADKMTCRLLYQGEVIYIIIFMFQVSMCFVFVLLFLCILLPTWLSKCPGWRRRNITI